jgi:septum formation protein
VSDFPPLILASASPRRRDYLDMLGLSFSVEVTDTAERVLPGETPEEHVERLSREKASAVARRRPEAAVLGGDTVVVLDDEILGKPEDAEDAERMLLRLSGRSHVVASGLALVLPTGEVRSGVTTTEVTFRAFRPRIARAYVDTGEPLDKAGAYGIQGFGAALVSEIRGDYYTVVGLPIPLLVRLFEECGWEYSFGSLHPVDP